MSRFNVVVTDDISEHYDIERELLSSIDAGLTVYDSLSQKELNEALRYADGILVNVVKLTADCIGEMERCRVISRYGIGYDNVDVETCTKKGIWVANVPDYCIREVGEHTLALLMSCVRAIPKKNESIRKGHWDSKRKDDAFRIYGKKIGLLGFGNIPRGMVPTLKALGLEIAAYDPFLSAERMEEHGVKKAEMNDLLGDSDFICIHLPLNDDTRGLLDERRLMLTKKGAVLVNTSRGGIIDEDALAGALESGHIAGAGLDVFKDEPLAKDSPLLKQENCIVTDHSAWYSSEALKELKTKCAKNVRDVLAGKEPIYPVNIIATKQ